MKRTPLRRKTPLRRRSLKNSYRRRARDLDHMSDVRRLPCAVRTCQFRTFGDSDVMMPQPTRCEGRVQADHAGERAYGKKAPDDTTIPMCRKHHEERTDYKGAFKNWKAEQMRAWLDMVIHSTRHEIMMLRSQRQRYA